MCKRIKAFRKNKHELLKSLFISKRYFIDISMNFIVALLVCKRNERNYKYIMIVVNRLSKKKKFVALNFLNVKAVVQDFVNWIWRKKKYSERIVFDRETQFVSHFWKRLCERIDIKLKLFFVWHFETDEQIERANADLKAYLRVYVNYKQNDWMNWLFIVEFEINSVKSSFTELESFLTIKKYLPRSRFESSRSITSDSVVKRELKNVDKLVIKLSQLKNFLREELKWIQNKQKEQANKKRQSTFEFRVRDSVMLNVKYQATIRFSKNLNYKNLNSFIVKRVVDNCVYELNLSQAMKNIFFVFHFWLLHVDDSISLQDQQKSTVQFVFIDDKDDVWYVEQILNSKMNKRRKNSVTEETEDCLKYKIKWINNENVNTTFIWHDYIDVNNALYAIIDYHHRYFDEFKSHKNFVRSLNWNSSESTIINDESIDTNRQNEFSITNTAVTILCNFEKSNWINKLALIVHFIDSASNAIKIFESLKWTDCDIKI